jgi:hypothetical protein
MLFGDLGKPADGGLVGLWVDVPESAAVIVERDNLSG